MSEFYRLLDIEPTDFACKPRDGRFFLNGSMDVNILLVPDDIDPDEARDGFDELVEGSTGYKNRMTVHSGFETDQCLPKTLKILLSLFGADCDPTYDVALGALYSESGFDNYSREDCDNMYVNTVLAPVRNGFLRGFLKGIVMPFVGNRLVWDNSSEQTSVATLHPMW